MRPRDQLEQPRSYMPLGSNNQGFRFHRKRSRRLNRSGSCPHNRCFHPSRLVHLGKIHRHTSGCRIEVARQLILCKRTDGEVHEM